MKVECFTNGDLSPTAYIELMFEKTGKDNTLLIPGFYYDENDESDKVYRCKMDWNKAKLEDVLNKYNDIYNDLKEVADKHRETKNIDAASIDAECELIIKKDKKQFEYGVLSRAKRLCRLLALHAPEIVVRNEARQFAQAMVLNRYCTEMTVISND